MLRPYTVDFSNIILTLTLLNIVARQVHNERLAAINPPDCVLVLYQKKLSMQLSHLDLCTAYTCIQPAAGITIRAQLPTEMEVARHAREILLQSEPQMLQ